jgi:hypothetical protein
MLSLADALEMPDLARLAPQAPGNVVIVSRACAQGV